MASRRAERASWKKSPDHSLSEELQKHSKFNAVVKPSGFKLLRNAIFQQDILEQTAARLLPGPAELRAVARHLFNRLRGWSDLSFHLGTLDGHGAPAGDVAALQLQPAHPQHAPQLFHRAEPLESPRICDRSGSRSRILLRSRKLCPLCPQLPLGSARVPLRRAQR